jgi:hypothetical protein
MGLSVLQVVSLPELIAETFADHVRIAAELAGNIDRLFPVRRLWLRPTAGGRLSGCVANMVSLEQ